MIRKAVLKFINCIFDMPQIFLTISKIYIYKLLVDHVNISKHYPNYKFNVRDVKSSFRVGNGCMFRGGMFNLTGGELIFGENVFLNHGFNINCRQYISFGDNCLAGPNLTVYDHDHDIVEGVVSRNSFINKNVIIENNVWIGANVTVLKGVKVGENSVIAANSVVTKDIAKNTIFIQKKAI